MVFISGGRDDDMDFVLHSSHCHSDGLQVVRWFLVDIIKNLFYVFVQMKGAFFIVVSIGFLCGILMKNMFAYLLIPAILVLHLFFR